MRHMLIIAALAGGLTPATADVRILNVQDNPVAGQTPEATTPPWTTEPPPVISKPETVPPSSGNAVRQPAMPGSEGGRFTLRRVNDGFLRLDTQTGQMALCSGRGAGWACQTVPEERTAFEQEIARLQDQVAALKKEMAALREPAPPRPPADLAPRPPADKGNDFTFKMPSQEEVDRATVAVQRAWKRLMDMLVGFRDDLIRKG